MVDNMHPWFRKILELRGRDEIRSYDTKVSHKHIHEIKWDRHRVLGLKHEQEI
jgi:hypothetical protein